MSCATGYQFRTGLTTLRRAYRGPIFRKQVGGIERPLNGLMWEGGDRSCLCMYDGISKEHMEHAVKVFVEFEVRRGLEDELGTLLANELRGGGA